MVEESIGEGERNKFVEGLNSKIVFHKVNFKQGAHEYFIELRVLCAFA